MTRHTTSLCSLCIPLFIGFMMYELMRVLKKPSDLGLRVFILIIKLAGQDKRYERKRNILETGIETQKMKNPLQMLKRVLLLMEI